MGGVEFCPRCQRPFIRADNSGDFVHTCNSGDASLDQESVVQLGDYTEFGASGEVTTWNYQGAGDSLTPRARAEGARHDKVDDRGFNSKTHRSRQHFEHIK